MTAPGSRTARTATVERRTAETAVTVRLCLDGSGACSSRSGLPFLDHMLAQLARHGGFDLDLACEGDLAVDDHHSVEDCALALGQALDRALGERRGIARFGSAYAPLDEALARVVVDLSGRPFARIALPLLRPSLGTLSSENVPHFLQSLAVAARLTLHVDLLHGDNDHHKVEAVFKALALGLRAAVATTGGAAVPSTKEAL